MRKLSLTLVFLLSLPAVCLSSVYEGIDLRTGKFKTVKHQEDRPMVALFLSSNCPCSQASFDYLNNLQKTYPEFQFVGFNSNKNTSKSSAMKYFKKFEIDFPILLDKNLIYANEFNALKTPHTFLKVKGNIVYQGGVTNKRNPEKASKFFLKDAIVSVKNKQIIKIKDSKTLGCFIRR